MRLYVTVKNILFIKMLPLAGDVADILTSAVHSGQYARRVLRKIIQIFTQEISGFVKGKILARFLQN